MVVKRRLGVLLAGTVLGTSFLMAAPAFADDAQLQQQINSMQQQLNAMQAQLAQTKAQANAAKQQATAAQQQASTAQQQASAAQQDGARTFRQISTTRTCRSRPRGRPRGSTPSTSRWPARSSRWKVRSASATKSRPAPAIRRSAAIPLANSPLYYRERAALQRPTEPHRPQGDRRHRSGAALGRLLRDQTGSAPA